MDGNTANHFYFASVADARTRLAFVSPVGAAPAARRRPATTAAPCTDNARTGRVSASLAGTAFTAPWKAVPTSARVTALARPTSAENGTVSVTKAGRPTPATSDWRAIATTASTTTKVKQEIPKLA